MRKIAFLLLVLFSFNHGFSQFSWTWLAGDALTNGAANFGIKGIPDSTNYPGSRTGQKTWIDKAGDTWVFGGIGYNDIWKYSATSDKWTWVNGTRSPKDLPVYGKKGVASSSNRIAARNYSAIWTDANGDLWVFGGQSDPFCAYAAVLISAGNDFWKYSVSTNQWTWMGGDTISISPVIIYYGRYGQKGIASAANKPPSKHHAMNWKDKEGNFWLFGGSLAGDVGNAYNSATYLSNDLWKYSPTTGLWTWITGDSTAYSIESKSYYANYGLKGLEAATNTPGSRSGATTWTDSVGNFWLLGGVGYSRATPPASGFSTPKAGVLNDLWKYSPVSGFWTWIGGDTTLSPTGRYLSPQPWPGGRSEGTGWTDKQGDLWLRSGFDFNSKNSFNDFWKYSVSNNAWTWMGGDSTLRQYSNVSVPQNIFQPGISPGPDPAVVTEKNDSLLLFSIKGDQRWLYNRQSGLWSFIKGEIVPDIPLPDTNSITPKARLYASTWTDKSNNLWMFGGQTTTSGASNFYDLWKFDNGAKTWTLKKGGEGTAVSIVGVQGQPSDSARPSNRSSAYTFVDQSGKLWMFGGTVTRTSASLDDLWSYDPSANQWTWYGSSPSGGPVYVATPSQPAWPGKRGNGNAWTDNAGNFWIFGGQPYSGYFSNKNNNEVWMFNPQTRLWTFMGGDKVNDPPPIFPKMPTGRWGATSWTDASGNLWLFGGASYNIKSENEYGEIRESFNNDLLKYNTVTKDWTRINGNGTINSRGNYGTKGVSSVNSAPRARKDAVGWSDGLGNLYLFGGSRDSMRPCTYVFTEQYNDLWKFSTVTNQWTWIGGDSIANVLGNYGTIRVPSAKNEPGGRSASVAWGDGLGNGWIFGGYGYAQSGNRVLNDLMMFTPAAESPLPVNFNSFTATRVEKTVSLQWVTAQEKNSRSFIIERSSDGLSFSPIGTVAASGTSNTPSLYTFTDINPLTGNNYYRLRQIDIDNNFMYSKIVKVDFADNNSRFFILSNPVKNVLNVNVELTSSERLTLRIMDANGRLIRSETYLGLKGNNTVSIPVSSMAQGSYILNINSKTISSAKTFFKL